MSFEQRAASLRASTTANESTVASASDIYNELLLQNAETPDTTSATAANQETQIANENTQIVNQQTIITDLEAIIENQQTIIAAQNSQLTQFAASTNNGVLIDEFYTQGLTAALVALPVRNSKTVTLINLSTNNALFYKTSTTAASLTLEAGYSVKINTTSANNISVRQAADTGQSVQIIVTA